MASTFTAAEARESLSSLLDEVEGGAEIEITRRGLPVAVLVRPSVLQDLRESRQEGFEALYDTFLRSVDVQRGAVDLELFLSMRERPGSPGSGR